MPSGMRDLSNPFKGSVWPTRKYIWKPKNPTATFQRLKPLCLFFSFYQTLHSISYKPYKPYKPDHSSLPTFSASNLFHSHPWLRFHQTMLKSIWVRGIQIGKFGSLGKSGVLQILNLNLWRESRSRGFRLASLMEIFLRVWFCPYQSSPEGITALLCF